MDMSITTSCGPALFGPDAILYIWNECGPALLLGAFLGAAVAGYRAIRLPYDRLVHLEL